MADHDKKTFPIQLEDAEWRQRLDAAAYQVLRHAATERPYTSPLNHEKRAGQFLCAGCGSTLFDSDTKFDSGCGWPSFYQAKDGAVATAEDNSHFMRRTEVLCAKCGGHLGHVFPDGPQPTGDRYCMNGVALKFQPQEKK
ncbi:peptide-methionine (R)-S-oxide reductase MsrB [Ferrovibrio sp.]|uniref:peptide-methionine (R)-S-oxide reductase MsrB n=1 Tax=Ferrovibrio sp. TaxID=1917215 RepID=UPI003D0C9D2A